MVGVAGVNTSVGWCLAQGVGFSCALASLLQLSFVIAKQSATRTSLNAKSCESKICVGEPMSQQSPAPIARAASQLNHISACAHDTNELRDRIYDYLCCHGSSPDEWHRIYDVMNDTKVAGWISFGKRVVDPLILLMVGAGEIEVDALPTPRMMRMCRGAY
jgi:hypothetical protein